MADLEKVIKGLECCKIPFTKCYNGGCPYFENDGCKARLKGDALALLKAQEPPTSASILSAIECLLHPQDADDSDMSKAIDTAVRAMRLLRDQESRVLTLEEVKSSHWILVWLELSFGAGHETVVVPIEITGVGTGGISFYFGNEDFRTYGRPVYGWRCWTSRPTDAQRKAAKWDDDEICYECQGYDDDYSINENGELVCNCDDCPFNPSRPEDE